MVRKGENIFKRKDGCWEGCYIKGCENGKAVYGYVFGKSCSEAKKKKAEAMAGLSSSRQASHRASRVRSISQVSEQPLMRDVAYQWLYELKAIRRRSMVAKYEGQLRNHTIPEFEEKHIDEIRNSDLVAFSQKLLRKPGKGNKALSPRTAADIVARIRSIRKFSLLHDYEVNYASDCTEIPQRAEKIRVLSSEEEKKLVTYLKENFNLTALGVLLSLFTGIRLDELCALKWSDFSLKEHEFHVNKTMQKLPNPDQAALKKTVIEIGEPKSPCSVRTIPISEKFMNYIRSSYADGAYVLSGHKYYFIEPRTMENRFKAILRKCGIQDTKFHALRHTFATRYVELGFDVKTLNCLATFLFQNFLLNPVLFNN